MTRSKTTSKIIEEGYFHISNSGLTFRIIENQNHWDEHGECVDWDVEIRFGAFGHGTSYRFPVMSNMAEYLANVFGRLHKRMSKMRLSGDYFDINHDTGLGGNLATVDAKIADGVDFREQMTAFGRQLSDEERREYRKQYRLLKKPFFGDLEVTGGTYLQELEKLRDMVREATYPEKYDGPARLAKVKPDLRQVFVEAPQCFLVATGGMTQEKRLELLSNLGIVDQELIAECLQIKSEGQATS